MVENPRDSDVAERLMGVGWSLRSWRRRWRRRRGSQIG